MLVRRSILPHSALLLIAVFTGCGDKPEKSAEKTAGDKTRSAIDGKSKSPNQTASKQPFQFSIPDRPITGTIGGVKFQPDRCKLDSGWLKLTMGKGFFPDASFTAMLHVESRESVDGRTYEFQVPPRSFGSPMINVNWKPAGERFSKRVNVEKYALKIIFGRRKGRRIDGRLHFRSLNDDDPLTEFAGTFTARIGPDLNKPPTDEDAPYVIGKVDVKAGEKFSLHVGMVGLTTDGKRVGNGFGTTYTKAGGGSGASLTFEPQITAMWTTKAGGLEYRHIGLKPGMYLVYFLLEKRLAAWKWIEVGEKSKVTQDFTLDSSGVGNLEISVGQKPARSDVRLIPLRPDGTLPKSGERMSVAFRLKLSKKPANGKATFEKLPAGRYRVQYGAQSKPATVESGKTARVTLKSSN